MKPAPASIFAVELLGELIRRGVTDVVVCPGSRSQALALAAAAAERAGAIRLHVRIDERSAGFFALGLARESGMPAPVIVTSGTAVANLAPAVLEAHEGRVPLMLLTADRPDELRGIRSNQTTRQAGHFGSAARLALDVGAPGEAPVDVERAVGVGGGTEVVQPDPAVLAPLALRAARGAPGGRPAGPVQLNLAFREPLSGTRGFERMVAEGFRAAAAERELEERGTGDNGLVKPEGSDPQLDEVFTLADDLPTVVIAGAGAGDQAAQFADLAGLPLLAEVVSEARTASALADYAEHLGDPGFTDPIRRAIVFGHPTLTREVPVFLKRGDLEVIVVDPHLETDHYDPSRSAQIVRAARVADERRVVLPRGGAGNTHEGSSGSAQNDSAPLTRESLVAAVWQASQPDDRLVVAASRLIRVLDRVAEPRAVRVHANRGLAGIDGTVSTALGIAAASGSLTRVLLGDLALLHDAGALLQTPGERQPRVQLIVGNDHGGTIFDRLEVKDSADPAAYERVMTTPQRADLAALAAAHGWHYVLAETLAQLTAALAATDDAPILIEAPLSRCA